MRNAIMAQLSIFSPVPIGHGCCIIDDYGAFSFEDNLFSHFSFFSAYRRERSLPYNYRCRQNSQAKSEVVGGFGHVL
ncbi:hypothetical protein [Arsenophonus endosymbiont of Aleurodicus floccissimus]|uniref:hypothetical protein n=1 Tax=Arsenophonus endosymbiont of Aleurodicus floccissimus TaxID=2152761 RepID=UPI001EDCB785|nr:hypothetical protein [Arsenophonus endosymbiont of Aleurodicus floccissimus]